MTVYLLVFDRMGCSDVKEVYESEDDANAVADDANDYWIEHDRSEPYSVESFDVIPNSKSPTEVTG